MGCLIVAAWQLVADWRLVSPVFLPGPDKAWAALVEGFRNGTLWEQTLATVQRMFYGWFLASLAGVVLGAVIGMSAAARAYLTPLLEFVRPMPASAMVPIAMALLGLTDAMALAVIAFGALWPVLLATVQGFAAVEPRLYEVGRALGMSRLSVVMKIALPNALPDILGGMRVGVTVALILSAVTEMIASREGLGHWILVAARSFRSSELFAGVILFGLIGYLSGQVLALAESRLLRWRVAR
jgi:ABC-type nitrate/sulfonate/bicarbonate transport system permease component